MITSRQIPFSETLLDRKLIFDGIGTGKNYLPDREMTGRVEAMIAEIAAIVRPCYIYNLLDAGPSDPLKIVVGGVSFTAGRVISPFFADAEKIAVFVATTGVEFGEWLHGIKQKGDVLEEFVADAIGSVFAEAVAERVRTDLQRDVQPSGNRTGNSYSPGYCGWSVKGQRELFSLLPPRPCGVTLGESCLMTPIKSVSGLIPVGRNVREHPYGCRICDMACSTPARSFR